MDINLKLEEECWVCNGSGTKWKDGPCASCGGLGQQLTTEGAAVIALVRRWLAVEPRAELLKHSWSDETVRNPLLSE